MSKRRIAGTAAVMITCAGAPTAAAQDPPPPPVAAAPAPSVRVTLGSQVRVAGAQALMGGPTRLRLSISGRSAFRYGVLYALRPGNSAATLRTALRADRSSAFFDRVLRLEGSVGVLRGRTRSFSVFLAPGTTYAIVDATQKSRARWRLTTFGTAPAISAATFPTPAATFLMTDDAFKGPTSLPRNAVVLLQNRGRRLLRERLSPEAVDPERAGGGAAAVRALRELQASDHRPSNRCRRDRQPGVAGVRRAAAQGRRALRPDVGPEDQGRAAVPPRHVLLLQGEVGGCGLSSAAGTRPRAPARPCPSRGSARS